MASGFVKGILQGLQPAPQNIANTVLGNLQRKDKAAAATEGQKQKILKEKIATLIANKDWDGARIAMLEQGMPETSVDKAIDTGQTKQLREMPLPEFEQNVAKQSGPEKLFDDPVTGEERFSEGSTFFPKQDDFSRNIIDKVLPGRTAEREKMTADTEMDQAKFDLSVERKGIAEKTYQVSVDREKRQAEKLKLEEQHRTKQRRREAMKFVHGSFMDSMKMVNSGEFTPRQGLSVLHNTMAMVNEAYGLDMSRPGASTPIVLAEKMYDEFALKGLMGNQISEIGGTRNIQSQAAYIVDKLKEPAVAKALGTIVAGGEGLYTRINQWAFGGAEIVTPPELTDFMFSLGYLEDDIKRMKSGQAVTEQEGAFYKELIGSLYTDPAALKTRMFSLIHKFQLRVDGQYQAVIDNKFPDPTERREYYDRIPQFTFKNGMTIAHMIAMREHGLKLEE